MKSVYLAVSLMDERMAFRLIFQALDMLAVGEAADWITALVEAPAIRPDMIMLDWGLMTAGADADLAALRLACPDAVMVVLTSHLSTLERGAFSAGADAIISRAETSDRVAERLRVAVASIPSI